MVAWSGGLGPMLREGWADAIVRGNAEAVVHVLLALSALQPGSLQVGGHVFSVIWR